MRLADIARMKAGPPEPVVVAGLRGASVAKLDVLAPHRTPDGRWHMVVEVAGELRFAASSDGVHFEPTRASPIGAAGAPSLSWRDGRYWLAHTVLVRSGLLGRPTPTAVALRTSERLERWSPPTEVLVPASPVFGPGRFVSDPALLDHAGGTRLYVGAGRVEGQPPISRTLAVADAPSPFGPYVVAPQPVLEPGRPGAMPDEVAVGQQRLVELDDGLVSLGFSALRGGGSRFTVRALGEGGARPVRPAPELPAPARAVGSSAVCFVRGTWVLYVALSGPKIPFRHSIFRHRLV